MINAPRQDWRAYAERARASDAAWIRGLTLNDRFDLYSDLFGIIWEAQHEWENPRLERWNWDRKVAMRLRLVEAFGEMDKLNRERAASHHAG
jgi:hypothetical protein